MLITALLALLAALLLFLSGRLILAFLPPGWPGFAPGMGTRELGATIGGSWLLGSLMLKLSAQVADFFLVSFGIEFETSFTGLEVGYIGVHVLLALALVLRAPAKLRPRHEWSRPSNSWLVRLLALALIALACCPTLVEVDVLRAEAQAADALAQPYFIVRWLHDVRVGLTPLALTLVLIGALQQLGLRAWVAWLTGLGCIASYLAMADEFLRQLPDFGDVDRIPLYALLVACIVGLVWARRADRRARTLALLMLAMLPLGFDIAAVPAALIGLSVVLFALPAGGRKPAWPWVLAIALLLSQLAYQWMFRGYQWRHAAPQLEIEQILCFYPPELTLERLDSWRLWLTAPVIVVIAVWFQARRSLADSVPYSFRVSWLLVALIPIAFFATGYADQTILLSTADEGTWSHNWRFELSDVVLAWVPALLVLVAVHFGPREAHANTTAVVPS